MKKITFVILYLVVTQLFAFNYINEETRRIGEKLNLNSFLRLDEYPVKDRIILYQLERDGFSFPINIYRNGEMIEAIGLKIFNQYDPAKSQIEQKLLKYLFVDKTDLDEAFKKDKVRITYSGIYRDIEPFRKMIELTAGHKKKKDLKLVYQKDYGYTVILKKDIEKMEIFIPEYKVKF